MVLPLLWSCSTKTEQNETKEYKKIPNSILIVYSSGTPSKTLSDVKPEEVDALSGATPSIMNVEIISQKLYNELKKMGYTVKLVKASEIENYKEILQYDMLIIGNPTYFWNVNWEIKKMLDINLGKIYIAKRKEFKKMKHVVFSMCEYDKCGERANKQMGSAITDCSGKLNYSMVFEVKSISQFETQINKLAASTDSIMTSSAGPILQNRDKTKEKTGALK